MDTHITWNEDGSWIGVTDIVAPDLFEVDRNLCKLRRSLRIMIDLSQAYAFCN